MVSEYKNVSLSMTLFFIAFLESSTFQTAKFTKKYLIAHVVSAVIINNLMQALCNA